MQGPRAKGSTWRRSTIVQAGITTMVLACTVAEASAIRSVPDLRAIERAFVESARAVRNSVVAIASYREPLGDTATDGSEPFNHGSGFVLDTAGLIATNHHVIANAETIVVTLAGGERHIAHVVGADSRADLAVLRIAVTGLRAATTSDLSSVEVGAWTFTLGNPFGIAHRDGNHSVSFGVISAKGKSLTGRFGRPDDDRYFGNLLQTDIRFHPGSSGGPLFNLDGDVIGIAAAILPDDPNGRALSFAIPFTRRTRRILRSLKEGRPIEYGALGADVRSLTRAEAEERSVLGGALITRVTGGGSRNPAARGGLRRQDVILRFGDERILDADHLNRLVDATPIGRAIEVQFQRRNEIHQTTVELVDRAELVSDRRRSAVPRVTQRMLTWRGCLLVEPTDRYLAAHNLDAATSGLYVSDVPVGSALMARGLKPGDVIVRYDGIAVASIEPFLSADDGVHDGSSIALSDGRVIVLP